MTLEMDVEAYLGCEEELQQASHPCCLAAGSAWRSGVLLLPELPRGGPRSEIPAVGVPHVLHICRGFSYARQGRSTEAVLSAREGSHGG